MNLKYIVFLSLILSGFSQKIISNSCERPFGGLQVLELTCNTTGSNIQWVVEPIVGISQNLIRFSPVGTIGNTITRENIVGILDSVNPLVSRLRITSRSILPTADVVCISDGANDTVPYVRDNYEPMAPVFATLLDSTMDSKCDEKGDVRYVTLNMKPLSPERRDVEGFSITYSQNSETIEMEPTLSNVTIVLVPGTVTFDITTVYECPFSSSPVKKETIVSASSQCISTLIFIWPALLIIIIIGLIVLLIVLCLKKPETPRGESSTSMPLPNRSEKHEQL